MGADNVAAIPLFRRAASLDSNFAMAFAKVGNCYGNLGEIVRATENLRKGYELRERVSENEKFYITSKYEMFVTGNMEAARKELGLWAKAYPRDDAPPQTLRGVFLNLGDFRKALAAAQESLRLGHATGIAYVNLAVIYMALNRLDEARATAREAHGLGAPEADSLLYQIDFLQHDAAGMDRDAAALMGKPGYEDMVLGLESDTAAYAGRRSARARELTRRAAA